MTPDNQPREEEEPDPARRALLENLARAEEQIAAQQAQWRKAWSELVEYDSAKAHRGPR